MKPVRRHEDSVIGRIEYWFRTHPDEELSYADIATKFGVSIEYARQAVLQSIAEIRHLESVHVVRLRATARPLVLHKRFQELDSV